MSSISVKMFLIGRDSTRLASPSPRGGQTGLSTDRHGALTTRSPHPANSHCKTWLCCFVKTADIRPSPLAFWVCPRTCPENVKVQHVFDLDSLARTTKLLLWSMLRSKPSNGQPSSKRWNGQELGKGKMENSLQGLPPCLELEHFRLRCEPSLETQSFVLLCLLSA